MDEYGNKVKPNTFEKIMYGIAAAFAVVVIAAIAYILIVGIGSGEFQRLLEYREMYGVENYAVEYAKYLDGLNA